MEQDDPGLGYVTLVQVHEVKLVDVREEEEMLGLLVEIGQLLLPELMEL